jgi:hypothetical protein
LVATEIEAVEPSMTVALGGLTDPPTPADAETVYDFGPPPPPHEINVTPVASRIPTRAQLLTSRRTAPSWSLFLVLTIIQNLKELAANLIS